MVKFYKENHEFSYKAPLLSLTLNGGKAGNT